MSKRHIRFEKTEISPTCRGFCTMHTIQVIRAPLFERFFGLFKASKMDIRKVQAVRKWDRVRGNIEGYDTSLSPCSMPAKAAA